MFDAGAVIPAAIENDDFTGSGKVLHISLHVHLRLLSVGGRRQGDNPENARADALGEGPNCAAFSSSITAFKNDDDAETFELDPILKLAEFALQAAKLFLILFAFQRFVMVIIVLWHQEKSNLKWLTRPLAQLHTMCGLS